jgi:hypothetical protein
MFSHVAEETTRLSHGFLGALFGFMLVTADKNFWVLSILCLALYVAFVLNTSILHLAFRLAVENRDGLFALVMLTVLETVILGGVVVTYFLSSVPSLDLKYIPALRFGLLVYAAFLGLMNISHMAEILEQKRKKHGTAGGAHA